MTTGQYPPPGVRYDDLTGKPTLPAAGTYAARPAATGKQGLYRVTDAATVPIGTLYADVAGSWYRVLTETADSGTSATVIVKTANESVTSSTTFQNDDTLVVPVEANKTYVLDFDLRVRGDTVADIKYQFTAPASATVTFTIIGAAVATASVNGDGTFISKDDGEFGASGLPGVGGDDAGVRIRAVATIGATAGNVTLQWAQLVSNATATTVLAGSSVIAHEVV